MGTADNGLTLEGLAQRLEVQGRENAERLETLERENERMRSENAALRSKVDTLEGSNTGLDKQTAAAFEGEVSRRSLLTKAGQPQWPRLRRARCSIRARPKPPITTPVSM